MGAYTCAQICRYLPEYQWEPIVLTAKPRYYEFVDQRVQPPATVLRTPVIPHPFALYRRVKSLFVPPRRAPADARRVDEERKPGPITVGESVVQFLSIPDVYTGWIAPAVLTGLRAQRRYGIERLVSSGPYWTNHVVGLALARATRLPWIAHFRDPWLDDLSAASIGELSLHANARLERAVVTHARTVVCVTEQHARVLRSRYAHLPAAKFVTIPNGYDEDEWRTVTAGTEGRDTPDSAKFVIRYAGWLYLDRNPEPLFLALRNLIDSGDVDGSRITIELIGWCEPAHKERLKAAAARLQLADSVTIEGPLMKAQTFQRITGADLLLLLAEDWRLRVPAKAYEYLRAKRPILALAPPDGAIADLFQKTGGAWVVDHRDAAGIAAAVREAYLDWRHGRPPRTADPAAVAEYDRSRLTKHFANVLDKASTNGATSA